MSDAGFDGVLDIPDEPLARFAHSADDDSAPVICAVCGCELWADDDPDCGEDGCPADGNRRSIEDELS